MYEDESLRKLSSLIKYSAVEYPSPAHILSAALLQLFLLTDFG